MSAPTRPRKRGNRPRLALVLSGGGARGAFEVGVIKYIRENIAGDLGGQVCFDIISGTSVGGIHACFLAGTAHIPTKQAKLLAERWESFVLEHMVSFGFAELRKLPSTLLGSGRRWEMEPGQKRLGGVVQTRMLEAVVRRLTPWSQINPNMQHGHIESLSVTATDIGSGKTVVFVESARELSKQRWSTDPFVRVQKVRMSHEHALASAAIPLLFPAIAIGERFYCDGGLRQNTPISPALRLGADRVLVVGLRRTPESLPNAPAEEAMPFPGVAFLAGKVLNAFLLDHVDYDLDRLRRFNKLISAVNAAASPSELTQFDEVAIRMRGAPYRVVDSFIIRPTVDLGAMAGDIAKSGRFAGEGGGRGIRMLHRLASNHVGNEADLLSYILFDGHYAAALIRQGWEDARAHHEELLRFLAPCVMRD